ncbi:MAG: aspartate aminotransferase family protein [Opitutales bacterium]
MQTLCEHDTTSDYARHLLGNYGPAPLTAVRGEGCYLWDDAGRRYLDLGSGIAVNALGHAHPRWVAAVQAQAAELVHCSNLYRIPAQGELARRLAERIGQGKLLFCNSGTEANEALIKLARLHGQRLCGADGQRFKILTAQNAFHGRTFGGMAATPQAKVQGNFHPMLPGFAHGKLNDAASFEALIDDTTCAIFLESIQGEGGINVAENGFMRDIRALCDRHQLMLLIDEVQCGIARSGRFFAYEYAGITPDAIGMAKGLGGGFPIGGIWVREGYDTLFKPGSHGTTFGGNPLASAAALAVLEVIETEGLVAHAASVGQHLATGLEAIARRFPHYVAETRGRGLMRAIELKIENRPVLAALREQGLLLIPAGTKIIRWLPPLIVSTAQIDTALEIFANVLESLPAETA